MADKIDSTLRDQLEAVLSGALTDVVFKGIEKKARDLADTINSDIAWHIKDNLARELSDWSVDMAQRAVEQLLEGNEDQMRGYLSCEKRDENHEYRGWAGRSDSKYWGRQHEAHEWHSVIHGKLFEQGAVALRKQIVDAHRDVLVNERILDLEDQVKSLVAQINKINHEKERMAERLRSCS